MPINMTFTGENGPHLVNELFQFMGAMQAGFSGKVIAAPETSGSGVSPAAPAPTKEEAKPAAKAAPKGKAKAAAVESKYTLQDAMDLGLKIVGDGSDDAVMQKVKKINTSFGVAKARELPADKIDAYVEALKADFPEAEEAEEGNLFG